MWINEQFLVTYGEQLIVGTSYNLRFEKGTIQPGKSSVDGSCYFIPSVNPGYGLEIIKLEDQDGLLKAGTLAEHGKVTVSFRQPSAYVIATCSARPVDLGTVETESQCGFCDCKLLDEPHTGNSFCSGCQKEPEGNAKTYYKPTQVTLVDQSGQLDVVAGDSILSKFFGKATALPTADYDWTSKTTNILKRQWTNTADGPVNRWHWIDMKNEVTKSKSGGPGTGKQQEKHGNADQKNNSGRDNRKGGCNN
ncbi:uncharacterized protein LOC129593633 [Paramacrobiotus metropolitanus]|nr:uncharacterized protein LOC129593633 [Paramacrobiotus metropolitanus]